MIRYRSMETPFGAMLHLAASERGLRAILFGGSEKGTPLRWLKRFGEPVVEDEAALAWAAAALQDYFAGARRAFDLPLDPSGTPFQLAVWAALRTIPYGETRSYRDIALQIGRPTALRAVARASAANPLPIVVPCHRVIGADGALRGYAGGLALKRALLELEGRLRAEEV